MLIKVLVVFEVVDQKHESLIIIIIKSTIQLFFLPLLATLATGAVLLCGVCRLL